MKKLTVGLRNFQNSRMVPACTNCAVQLIKCCPWWWTNDSPKHVQPLNEKIKTIHKNLCISLVYIHISWMFFHFQGRSKNTDNRRFGPPKSSLNGRRRLWLWSQKATDISDSMAECHKVNCKYTKLSSLFALRRILVDPSSHKCYII